MSKNRLELSQNRIGVLESRLGYRFRHYANIERALTHSSARRVAVGDFHYERLEFLGDRVLGLIVAQMLFDNYSQADEGELSLRLNSLVKGTTLADISDELGLHEYIRTGSDLKELTSKRMQNIRADVLESVIASIFLDGGLKAASEFIERFWRVRLLDNATARRDSKTELQEWSHTKRYGMPNYREKSRSGPDHDPVFTIVVQVEGCDDAVGSGSSKRMAEQDAARKMLLREGVWSAKEAIT